MSQSREIIPSKITVLKLLDLPAPRERLPSDPLVLTLLVMNVVAAIATLTTLAIIMLVAG